MSTPGSSIMTRWTVIFRVCWYVVVWHVMGYRSPVNSLDYILGFEVFVELFKALCCCSPPRRPLGNLADLSQASDSTWSSTSPIPVVANASLFRACEPEGLINVLCLGVLWE